ncbi:hypothetical protein K474DRAFT_1252134 [Panus rudis PR-1116 ss-1]|nr:hypothetical protein K474DRAFT_1252134 [Panus rudis PR-1116 ss-1]
MGIIHLLICLLLSCSRRDDNHDEPYANRRYPQPYAPRLPAELLSYIFILGAQDDPVLPLIVSHVCRSWRNLALHTPSLWRFIALDARLRLWAEYIRRARACTLDIQLTPRGQLGYYTTSIPRNRTHGRHYLGAQSVQLYIQCVAPHIPRWRSLEIEFRHYAPYLWNAALSPCCGHGPALYASQLERLSLIHPHNDDTKEFLLFGGYAPKLRHVTIHGIRLTWLPSLYSNLTVLDYTHHGFTRGSDAAAELLYMLQTSNQVRDLRVSLPSRVGAHTSYPVKFPAEESVLLAQLRTLEIVIDDADLPSAMIYFIAHISVPALHTLRLLMASSTQPSLRHGSADPSSRLRHFLKALPRLYTVRHLELEHTWLSDQRFLFMLLHVVPSLTHLTLRGGRYVTNSILFDLCEILRARYRSSPNYPLVLNVLEFDHCDGITAGALVDVVRHRLDSGGRRGGPCVRTLCVRDCAGVDVAALKRFQLVSFGVRLRVWWKGEELDIMAAQRTHR